MTGTAPPDAARDLGALRDEIDRIDSDIHALLLERGRIVGRLIEAKGTAASGSAFRPGREADMMRRLVARHEAQATILPLSTVEGIWRVIVATFTHAQAPFSVHADVSGEALAPDEGADLAAAESPAAMRDSARFHFGFVPPFVAHEGAAAVVAAVAASRGDLGLVRADRGEAGPRSSAVSLTAARAPWWRALEGPSGPKIIARLPFTVRDDHPAGLPVYVVARPALDPGASAGARDVLLHAVRVERWRPELSPALAALGATAVADAADAVGLSLLVSGPPEAGAEAIRAALQPLALGALAVHEVGGHAARVRARADG